MHVFMCAASIAFLTRYVFRRVTASTSASPMISGIRDPSTLDRGQWYGYACAQQKYTLLRSP